MSCNHFPGTCAHCHECDEIEVRLATIDECIARVERLANWAGEKTVVSIVAELEELKASPT